MKRLNQKERLWKLKKIPSCRPRLFFAPFPFPFFFTDSLLPTKQEKIEGKYQKEAEKTAKLKEANQELLESQKQLQEQNNSVGLEKEQALLQVFLFLGVIPVLFFPF